MSTARQIVRENLSGPRPLDLLRAFSNEPVAFLYSGDDKGHSVLARRPYFSVSASQARYPPSAAWLDDACGRLLTVPVAFAHSPSPLTAYLGFLSYDAAYTFEDIGSCAVDDTNTPLLRMSLYEEYYLYDHAAGTWSLYSWSDRPGRLDAMAAALAAPVPPYSPAAAPSALAAALPRDTYLAHVLRIKEYIAAGDIYQANYAQRWTVTTPLSPADVFLNLARHSPAEFSALLVDHELAVVSASPELLLHRRGNHIVTRPIKGTRPRDLSDSRRDAALRDGLLAAEKDKAELVMIVDLLRNDLGRVASFGSVNVTAPRTLERLPTLWHTTATVEADLRPGVTWPDVIRALCPGGSVTGAPKIRAVQILDELEPYRRGVYCGSIVALNPATDSATFNIAIRTIQMAGRTAHVWAGGGIVADSDPGAEYEESLHKAAAMFRALNLDVPGGSTG